MPTTVAALTEVTQTSIRELLGRSNYAVEEALLRLHDRQTADEQVTYATRHANGIGFSAFDAPFLSSLAEQVRANRRGYPNGRRLSDKQMAIARKKIMKYVGQLTDVANAKRGVVAYPDNIEEAEYAK